MTEICANDPTYMQMCNEIACPPTGDACNPDPVINGQVTAAGIGCLVPTDANPYINAAIESATLAKLLILFWLLIATVAILIND